MSKQILIIDDEASIRETLSGILEDEGFSPICAASAEEGIVLLEENTIDLILLDIWLGDNMDGLTALEKIKEIAKLDASVTLKSNSTYVLKHDKPILVGYKSLPIPRSVFATAVDATGDQQQLTTLLLLPDQVQIIKKK